MTPRRASRAGATSPAGIPTAICTVFAAACGRLPVRQWMREAGVDYPLVIGGYKAMRRFLLEELERSARAGTLVLVAGKTGTGKTRVIEAVERAVDLEGLALHRGSSFGRLLDPQPAQIDFENALAIELLRRLAGGNTLVLEDEGKLIGRLSPAGQPARGHAARRCWWWRSPWRPRVEVIFEDYVLDLGRALSDRTARTARRHQAHLRTTWRGFASVSAASCTRRSSS